MPNANGHNFHKETRFLGSEIAPRDRKSLPILGKKKLPGLIQLVWTFLAFLPWWLLVPSSELGPGTSGCPPELALASWPLRVNSWICCPQLPYHKKGTDSTSFSRTRVGNVSETPTPTTCLKSTAVHLQFVRQYAPHLYRRAFLASKLRRKGNPAIHLPFVLQYASHLYGSTPPICTVVLLEKYWGLGSLERF